MAQDNRIELIIEGLPEDEGRVRLNAFTGQMQKLSAALTKADKEANSGKVANVFQIVELSYSSPVRVALEARPLSDGLSTGHVAIERLKHVARAIETQSDLSIFDADILEDFKGLASPVGKTVKNTTLVINGAILDLTPRVALQLEEALAVGDECEGSLEGDLDQINVHQ